MSLDFFLQRKLPFMGTFDFKIRSYSLRNGLHSIFILISPYLYDFKNYKQGRQFWFS